MRSFLVSVAAIAMVAATSSAAPIPKERPKTPAEKIVGTWKMVKSTSQAEKQLDVFVEFTKDGKLSIRRSQIGGRGGAADEEVGTYKVTDDKLDYTFGKGTDAERSATDDIKTLTENELVTLDPDGAREEYVRVVPKKDK